MATERGTVSTGFVTLFPDFTYSSGYLYILYNIINNYIRLILFII